MRNKIIEQSSQLIDSWHGRKLCIQRDDANLRQKFTESCHITMNSKESDQCHCDGPPNIHERFFLDLFLFALAFKIIINFDFGYKKKSPLER